MRKPKYRKILLGEDQIPRFWTNIQGYLESLPSPPLNPQTREPIGPQDLQAIFPMALIEQEVSLEREVEIPEPVRKAFGLWRPTPLIYAENLRKFLDTPAHIFYKQEGVSPPGSHKPNTAVAQAFYSREEGIKRLTTETGAGQWGSALAFAGTIFGVEVKIYMVKVSYRQKPGRRILIESYGANVVPSPSPDTQPGRSFLEKDPENPGSLGIAISEAVFDAATRDDTNYSLGSVLNHVLLHQTIIGEEAMTQMAIAEMEPDVIIGCVGGGSNFSGLAFPFLARQIEKGGKTRFLAVEPEACPTLTKGEYAYDFGDTAGMAPLLLMYTLGHTFIPPGIHAGGLRYHGMAPLVSHLHKEGLIEARAYHQKEVFDAALTFAKTEGILPAPETAHAVKAAIDEALKAKREGSETVILFNFSGHGYFDLSAYQQYHEGQLKDYSYPKEKVAQAISLLPKVG